MNNMVCAALGGALLLLATTPGCVRAPSVSVVDNRTALERQAAGEYHALENDLDQAGISPRAEVIPREELASANGVAGDGALGEVAMLYARAETDAEWIDRMLAAGCVGEALNALLETTPNECKKDIDTGEMTRILGRANLHRRQMWQLIREQRPAASPTQVRLQWRRVHLKRVVCGGLIQNRERKWEAKKC